jgi:two-component system, chemotaxis family, chemotaxis protein CheY
MSSIVLVDDDAALRSAISLTLGSAGYTVYEAANGQEGLDAIENHNPDLVISDFTMPVMSGIHMVAALRENDKTKQLPVVMMTSSESIEIVNTAMIYDIKYYFNKNTMHPQLLLESIQKILSAASATQSST